MLIRAALPVIASTLECIVGRLPLLLHIRLSGVFSAWSCLSSKYYVLYSTAADEALNATTTATYLYLSCLQFQRLISSI